MIKLHSRTIRDEDPKVLWRLFSEYRDYQGLEVELKDGYLVVHPYWNERNLTENVRRAHVRRLRNRVLGERGGSD